MYPGIFEWGVIVQTLVQGHCGYFLHVYAIYMTGCGKKSTNYAVFLGECRKNGKFQQLTKIDNKAFGMYQTAVKRKALKKKL